MPKKQAKGPFFFFLMEYKQRCERNGERFPDGIRDETLKENAGAEWKVLPANSRKKYEDLAKEDKLRVKGDSARKETNMHRTFSSIDRMKQEELNAKEKMINWIERKILSLSTKKYLAEYKFYLVHMNYFCITEGDVYHPAEIAISEFSLGEGITNVYHTLVTGRIPLGYRHDAMQKAEQTHKIPIDNDGTKDINKIMADIRRFLEPGRRSNGGEYPPMFTMYDNVSLNTSSSCVKSVMENLCMNTMDENPEKFPVYSIEKLFFELKNASAAQAGEDGFPTVHVAQIQLEEDVFNFTEHIACQFHVKEDVVIHCSKSFVQRWVFLICDHCCRFLDIEVIRGKHLPLRADVDFHKTVKELEEKPAPTPAPFTWMDFSKTTTYASGYAEEPPLPRPTIQPNLAAMMPPEYLSSSEYDFPAISLGRGRGVFRGRGGNYGRGRGPSGLSFASAARK